MIPGWLSNKIAIEREVRTMKKMIGQDVSMDATDAEVCACLMDASFKAPLTHDATQIYLFLATKLMQERDMEVPEDVRVTELTREQERELKLMRDGIGRRLYRDPTPLESSLKRLVKTMNTIPVMPPGQTTLIEEVES